LLHVCTLAYLLVTALLEGGNDTRLEEDLAETDTVLLLLDAEGVDELLRGNLGVHETLGDGTGGEDLVALLELGKGNALGETHADDTDTFEDTVAAELVEDEGGINDSGLLDLVGDDATDKVGVGLVEGVEQVLELLLVALADSDKVVGLAAANLVLFRVDGVLKELGDELVGRLAEEESNAVVDGVLVLVEPCNSVVLDLAGVVRDDKHLGVELELGVLRALAVVLGVQLLDEALVGGLGEEALLIEDRHDTHGLLDQVNRGLEVETEIDHLPLDTLGKIIK